MTCVTDPTVGFVIDHEQLEEASRDLQTIERIANNIGVTTTTRLGDTVQTLEGRLQDIVGNTYEQLNGGVWASGITFNNYNEYMVYNGAEYKPKPSTVLPIVSGVNPSTDFELFFSRTNIEDAKNTIDAYNKENIGKYTAPVFGSIQDMSGGITVGMNEVDFHLGMLLILNDGGEIRLFEVVDGATLGAEYTLINGMKALEVFARQKEVEVYPDNPLEGLGTGYDARRSFTLSHGSVQRPAGTWAFGGGILSSNGYVFMMPDGAGSPVLRIETITQVATALSYSGSSIYKSSVLAPNGLIYSFGEHQNILKIDPILFTVTELTGLMPASGVNGAYLSPENGKIYCAPSSSGERVWEFDPSTEAQAVEIGSVVSAGGDSWNFGCVAGNGKIYMAPWSAGTILEVDTSTMTTTEIGSGLDGCGGAVLGINGKIYMPSVGKITVFEPDTSQVYNIPAPLVSSSGYGGVVLLDGSILFCPPFSSSSEIFTLINPKNEQVFIAELFGLGNQRAFAGAVSDSYGRIYFVEYNALRDSIMTISGVEGGIDYQFSAYANKL